MCVLKMAKSSSASAASGSPAQGKMAFLDEPAIPDASWRIAVGKEVRGVEEDRPASEHPGEGRGLPYDDGGTALVVGCVP